MTQALLRTRQYEASAPPRLILGRTGSTTSGELSPSWRGVSHEKAFAMAPAMALLLVSSAEGARAQVAAVIFAATMTGMLGVSALNHRTALGPNWQPWLRRADHAAINFFLAGTCTSVALVTLSGSAKVALIALVWGIAAAASLVTFVWVDVPGWIPATIAVGVGWSTGVALVGAAAVVGARVSSSCSSAARSTHPERSCTCFGARNFVPPSDTTRSSICSCSPESRPTTWRSRSSFSRSRGSPL